MTAGAGSGAAGAGSRVAGADEAVRRGAGSARRGGRGLGRGALTVTSGRVSDIWPQAASTPVKAPDDASAPSAAARNKRRFAAASRDASQPSPPAPRMAPTGKFPSNSGTSAGSGSHEVLPIPIGNIWQCGRGDTPCRRPPGCSPADVRPPSRGRHRRGGRKAQEGASSIGAGVGSAHPAFGKSTM